jgi:nucleotide-binding universal stress UspA family protein
MRGSRFRILQEITMGSTAIFSQREGGAVPFMLRPSESIVHQRARVTASGPKLLVCVDDSPQSACVASHARALAGSLGLSVTLAKVMPTDGDLLSPADPLKWQMRRRRQAERLNRLAEQVDPGTPPECIVLAGDPAEELSRWSCEHGVTLLALAQSCKNDEKRLGSTARRLLDNAGVSLLLVPAGEAEAEVRCRRVLVPVDGSVRAESVLPVALRIARRHGAEVVLAHVVQSRERSDALRTQQICDLELELDRHNGRHARTYLASLRNRARENNLKIRTVVLGPGDPRLLLSKLIDEEAVDLTVMSAQGQTGMENVSCGSVADYLLTHSGIPSLVLRPNLVCSFGQDAAGLATAPVIATE